MAGTGNPPEDLAVEWALYPFDFPERKPMSTGWFNRLEHAARQAGDNPMIWQGRPAPRGTAGAQTPQLMILPRAGRLIACQMPGVDDNLFFHHHLLEDPARAAQLIEAGAGFGGDRLWIAPESAYRWKDLAKVRHDLAGNAFTPRSMDPADYRIRIDEPGRLQLVTQMNLHDERHNQSVSLRVSREMLLIEPPSDLPDQVACVSFALSHELTMLEAGPQSQAGVWVLLQLPVTGTLICPTTANADPLRSYYDSFGPDRVQVDASAVRFGIDSTRCMKMGIRPELTTGRMGYLRQVGDVSTLIVRIFHPQPGRPYVDMPVDEILSGSRLGGDALQAYNHDGSGNIHFGEMEYHDPAVLGSQTVRTVTGTSVTHVLAGPAHQIEQIGRRLLGVAIHAK